MEQLPEVRVEIEKWLTEAWAIFRDHMGPFLGFSAIVVIIAAVANKALAGLPSLILGGPVAAGFYIVTFKIMRGESYQFGDFFSGFMMFLPTFLVLFIYQIAVFVGLIFLIVPGVYLAVVLMWGLPLVVDKRMGAVEALDLSRKYVNKNFWGFFLYALVCGGILFAGVLVLGIGLFFAVPYVAITGAVAYRSIFREGDGVYSPSEVTRND